MVPTRGGFWLVSTVIDVQAKLPAMLSPQVRLQRATDWQIKEIKTAFPADSLFGNAIEEGRENDYVFEKTEGGERATPIALPRDRWRYFVLAYEGNGGEALQVKQLLLLGEPPCTCRFMISTTEPFGEGQRNSWGGEMYVHTGSFMAARARFVTEETIAQVSTAFTRLQKVRDEFPEIPRAINMLNDLRMIPNHADLYVLGLFSILELLLTHQPNDKEIGDSITHQLSTKIPLLDKRLPEPIDYSQFKLNPTKLWRRLYAFRSTIAHGEQPNFPERFRDFDDVEVVREFVQGVCRKLIRHAITDPHLYRDLKAV